VFFSLTPPASPGGSWTETDLYSFPGVSGVVDIQSNPGNLELGGDGVFYGVTQGVEYGSFPPAGNPATVFSLTPPAAPGDGWTEEVLYTFTFMFEDGPPLGPVLAAKGRGGRPVLYGEDTSDGTVYALTPPATAGDAWTETVLATDLVSPSGLLAMGQDGILYGTTGLGGQGMGTVYSLTPPAPSGSPWTQEVLYNFGCCAEGVIPTTGVVVGEGGVLYGTTSRAFGSYPGGAVFSLTPPSGAGESWTPTAIYTFTKAGEPTNGITPGGLTKIDGVFYGNTETTVFTVTQ
jgi:hypothetical protein